MAGRKDFDPGKLGILNVMDPDNNYLEGLIDPSHTGTWVYRLEVWPGGTVVHITLSMPIFSLGSLGSLGLSSHPKSEYFARPIPLAPA